jgi:hypothetical protein
VRVRIYPKTDKNLKSYMEDIQVFQKRTCKEFEQDIYIESANSKTLFTQCIMAYGQIIPTLRKVIQGESATFIFERIFPTTMTPQQRTDWLNYMSNLTLCNEQTENCTTSNSF